MQDSLPDTSRYVHALSVLENQITQTQRNLLALHWSFANHTATATELARKAGLSGFRAVNSHYGRLGTLLREEMSYTGPGAQSYIISWFDKPSNEWHLHMQPQMAAALEHLGWVKSISR